MLAMLECCRTKAGSHNIKSFCIRVQIWAKSNFVGNLETLKSDFIEQGKKIAFLEAAEFARGTFQQK